MKEEGQVFVCKGGARGVARFQWEVSPYIMLFLTAVYKFKLIKLPTSMCFLKFIPQTPASLTPTKDSPLPTPTFSHLFPLSLHQQPKAEQGQLNNAQLAMLSCLKLLAINSQTISALDQKLQNSDALLTQTRQLVTVPSMSQDTLLSSEHLHEGESTTEEGQAASDPLTVQLFGQRSYKYQLVLASPFPDTLYKDRNFGLSFKLLNIATGAIENNGNLVNVCLGVCDSEGEWVHETREGGPMLKGKLEGELYHGAGQFAKLSPRDVSRNFPGKKITLVAYAKPSLLQYSGESSLERKIQHNLIEPLLVKDITIKAKRRE